MRRKSPHSVFFRLLAIEIDSPLLRDILIAISDDIQGGSSISKALSKHPQAFSSFYVSMVRSGEEAGKIDTTFGFLADYLERTYEVTAKAKNALIYPIFVIITFVGVMVLMFVTVIPSISTILTESGQTIPFYTRVVLGISTFFGSLRLVHTHPPCFRRSVLVALFQNAERAVYIQRIQNRNSVYRQFVPKALSFPHCR